MNAILRETTLSLTNAAFLVEIDHMKDAEKYLLERADQLNGDLYIHLLPLAETMESAECYLAATVVYRSLLDSILRRGQTKTYSHGVRYLKKMDLLAKLITDWQAFGDHIAYTQKLRKNHGRKSSFWSRYENMLS